MIDSLFAPAGEGVHQCSASGHNLSRGPDTLLGHIHQALGVLGLVSQVGPGVSSGRTWGLLRYGHVRKTPAALQRKLFEGVFLLEQSVKTSVR